MAVMDVMLSSQSSDQIRCTLYATTHSTLGSWVFSAQQNSVESCARRLRDSPMLARRVAVVKLRRVRGTRQSGLLEAGVCELFSPRFLAFRS